MRPFWWCWPMFCHLTCSLGSELTTPSLGPPHKATSTNGARNTMAQSLLICYELCFQSIYKVFCFIETYFNDSTKKGLEGLETHYSSARVKSAYLDCFILECLIKNAVWVAALSFLQSCCDDLSWLSTWLHMESMKTQLLDTPGRGFLDQSSWSRKMHLKSDPLLLEVTHIN